MTALYELAILGVPSDAQIDELQECVSQAIAPFGLRLGHEVAWSICPDAFSPEHHRVAAAVFFGGSNAPEANIRDLLRSAVPVLPVVSDYAKVSDEIPPALRPLNCMAYNEGGAQRVATGLLECAGLLPRQRRVFLSYRRNEARQAAVQLFDALAARHFDVFLDTHGIAPAEDFQAMLWHRLCDSDVLVMLDTPSYFDSRWTSAEYGRALAKGISVLQVQWPDCSPSPRTSTAVRVRIEDDEIESTSGRLAEDAVARICLQLEKVRSQSLALRNLSLVSKLRGAIERIGGSVAGVGQGKAVFLRLADGRSVVAFPTVGVPTSTSLHDAAMSAPDQTVAVIYDHVGLHRRWLAHMEWLGTHIRVARWVRAEEIAWQFADWEALP